MSVTSAVVTAPRCSHHPMGVRGLQSGRLERELRAGRASQQAEYLSDIGPHRVLRHARGGCHLAVAQPLDNRPVDVLQAFSEPTARMKSMLSARAFA